VNSPLHGVDHYENFPVASWLTPRRLRPAIVAIYRFARYADDLADEGNAMPETRLRGIAELRDALTRAQAGHSADVPLVRALAPYVVQHQLSWTCFHALLKAFEHDVTVHRYADEAALMAYCQNSANPVGHLMLRLFECDDALNLSLSDSFCSALQRLNFLQDIAQDWQRGRLYLPLDLLARHGLDSSAVAAAAKAGRAEPALRACIQAESDRVQTLLNHGSALPYRVGGRLGWELRAMIAGAQCIIRQMDASDYDPFQTRPRLRWRHAWELSSSIAKLAWSRSPPSHSPAIAP
jgi:squalene synthase HpnC